MNLNLPRAGEPISKDGVASRAWYQFLREIPTVLGFVKETPIWGHREWAENKTLAAAVDTGVARVTFYTPCNYKEGTDIYAYMAWIPRDATAGNIRFYYRESPTADGIWDFGSETEFTEESPEVADLIQIKELFTTNGDGITRGYPITLAVGRNGTDPLDTYAGNAMVLNFGIRFQIEGAGDVNQHPKG